MFRSGVIRWRRRPEGGVVVRERPRRGLGMTLGGERFGIERGPQVDGESSLGN